MQTKNSAALSEQSLHKATKVLLQTRDTHFPYVYYVLITGCTLKLVDQFLFTCKIEKLENYGLAFCATLQKLFPKSLSAKPDLSPPVCTADSTLSKYHTTCCDSVPARTRAPTTRERFLHRKLCTISFIFCEFFNF